MANLPSQELMTKTHDYLQYYLQITLLLRITIFAKLNSEVGR